MTSTSRYRYRNSAAAVSQNAELAYCCILATRHTPVVRFFSHNRDMKRWIENFDMVQQQSIYRYVANGQLHASSDTMFLDELATFIIAITTPFLACMGTRPYTKVAFNSTISFNLIE